MASDTQVLRNKPSAVASFNQKQNCAVFIKVLRKNALERKCLRVRVCAQVGACVRVWIRVNVRKNMKVQKTIGEY